MQYGEVKPLRNIRGADLLDREEQLMNPTVGITPQEADFLEIGDGTNAVTAEGDEIQYEVVDEQTQRRGQRRPLVCRRVLSEDDLTRLKELRVTNLMKIWNRTRDEVGLEEDRESEDEIDPMKEIESSTVLKKRAKELRRKAGSDGVRLRWDEYMKDKGGGSTNKEKDRNKPFMMTKYALKAMKKGKRSLRLKNMIRGQHKRRLKDRGKHKKKMRRR